MKLVHALSFLALALTIVPPVLFATGSLGEEPMKLTMIAGVVLWFLTAPRWLHGGEG